MIGDLPIKLEELIHWKWDQFEPYYQDLKERTLDQGSVQGWLSDWAQLRDVFFELYSRLYVAVSVDTSDQEADERFKAFFDETFPRIMQAEEDLKVSLLKSGLEPPGFEVPLRNMRAESDLFRADNLPLLGEDNKKGLEYEKVMGEQMVTWEGQERTVEQMRLVFQDADRARREEAWRLVAERQLADREEINRTWVELLSLRRKIAQNAGRADYRAYRWQELLRFDYNPEDARRFQDAIEKVAVPAAQRLYERRRERLGVDRLRPWDLDVDIYGFPPLKPFQQVDELVAGTSRIFHRVDPVLGGYFDLMANENLLDLDSRKNKTTGGFCTDFPMSKRPFILCNAVGKHDDMQVLLHEGGHAFHVFESSALSSHMRNVPTEFAEVASMGMELLASPYLAQNQGGFYTPAEAARARIEHLGSMIKFWPYMAVVDSFQHWVYENPDAAGDPSECDAAWSRFWQRFMTGVDWTGLEDAMETGWQRKPHIHSSPFYYIEYGIAQLGAVQVWGNSMKNQAEAVAAYRRALSLGGTVTLPELFQAAGARFAFDASVLHNAIALMEAAIQELESEIR